jgi:hypothetical protein
MFDQIQMTKIAAILGSTSMSFDQVRKALPTVTKAATMFSQVMSLEEAAEISKTAYAKFSKEFQDTTDPMLEIWERLSAMVSFTEFSPKELRGWMRSLRTAQVQSGDSLATIIALTAATKQAGSTAMEAGQRYDQFTRAMGKMDIHKYIYEAIQARGSRRPRISRWLREEERKGMGASVFDPETGERRDSLELMQQYIGLLNEMSAFDREKAMQLLFGAQAADFIRALTVFKAAPKRLGLEDQYPDETIRGFDALRATVDAVDKSMNTLETGSDEMSRTLHVLDERNRGLKETLKATWGATFQESAKAVRDLWGGILADLDKIVEKMPTVSKWIGSITYGFAGVGSMIWRAFDFLSQFVFAMITFRAAGPLLANLGKSAPGANAMSKIGWAGLGLAAVPFGFLKALLFTPAGLATLGILGALGAGGYAWYKYANREDTSTLTRTPPKARDLFGDISYGEEKSAGPPSTSVPGQSGTTVNVSSPDIKAVINDRVLLDSVGFGLGEQTMRKVSEGR